MPIAFFVLGHAGAGKTFFAKNFIKNEINNKSQFSWVLLDKDTSGERLSKALMISLGLDRFKKSCQIYSNLKLGINNRFGFRTTVSP